MTDELWLLKYDDERDLRRWTAVGPDGRLGGDVETVEDAIALLREAGAPRMMTFFDVRVDDSQEPS